MDKTTYRELLNKYIEIYFPHIKEDNDAVKNQKNKVRNLLKKMKENELFAVLPFDYLNIDENLKILHHFLENVREREFISNICKGNVDKTYDDIEINYENSDSSESIYYLDIKHALLFNRCMIRISDDNLCNLINYLISQNCQIYKFIKGIIFVCYDLEHYYKGAINLDKYYENLNILTEYIDYIANDIFQLINYKIILNSKLNLEKLLNELLNEVDINLDRFNKKIIFLRKVQKEKNLLTADKVTKYFLKYVIKFKKINEEINIYNKLQEEINKCPKIFGDVEKQYKVEKIQLNENKIKQCRDIITEGKKINEYEKKIEIVRKFIRCMKTYGSRDCHENCLQDLKVYFREIYISKSKYGRQQAHTIVENYISKFNEKNNILMFEKESQYIFIREKINRGYFREIGKLSEYIIKIEFTKQFYKLLLKAYLYYDFEQAIIFLYETHNSILVKIRELINE